MKEYEQQGLKRSKKFSS